MSARILVTGDVLRPQEGAFLPAQDGNIRWFHRLAGGRIAAATGAAAELLSWSPDGTGFDTPGFYAAAGAEPSVEGWAGLFAAEALPREALAMLAAPFAGVAAVIGFELPEVMKRLIHLMGLPFLDVNIHPWRFGPDVLFAVQTNHAGICAALAPWHAPAAQFLPFAEMLAAQAVKMPPDRPIAEPCLVLGQTRVDRSLIRDGRLVDLADHAEALRAAVGEARVGFRAHPYNPDGFGLYGCGIPARRIRPLSANLYVLLAEPAIRRVVAVSSSAVAEARFFGKEGVFLAPPPFDVPDTADGLAPWRHASVVDGVLEADFWRAVLAPVLAVTPPDGQRSRRAPNTLRVSLRNFWGYNEVSTDFLVELTRREA